MTDLDAQKSFNTLLKENGRKAALQSGILVTLGFLQSYYLFQEDPSLPSMLVFYFLSCAYFTWKPKLIRFLKTAFKGKKGEDDNKF
ncbi:MAG: hypothetical protein H2069_07160 [Legionella sp.]|nr:hypothetical protein [Legionella sp.]